MILLFETPEGISLFKVLDEGKLSNVEDLVKEFASPDSARKMLKLKAFYKFDNISEAAKLLEGDPKDPCKDNRLCSQQCCNGASTRCKSSVYRAYIPWSGDQDLAPMTLGLSSHSLARYKLNLSSDKVETMIIQAIGLLDDLDKELNTYANRVRKCYRWHFPELVKIIPDNIEYAKSIKLMGLRTNATKLDFSEILAEEVEAELKEAAMTYMEIEVNDLNLMHIHELCDHILSLAEYRAPLYDYLKSGMNTVAPNLTALVGELVGARLISSGGSLLNLSKKPGCTLQFLGKTKRVTTKKSLIYHASLVGQAAPKQKRKLCRSLAAKIALAVRCDAFGDGQVNTMGLSAKLEARLRNLEGKPKNVVLASGGLVTPAKAKSESELELLMNALEKQCF